MTEHSDYPARLEIDYPESLNRLTTFFRILWIIPIAIILSLVSSVGETVNNTTILNEAGQVISTSRQTAGGLASSLFLATLLMIVFRQRYPRWWFDFVRELTRFEGRVAAYLFLLTDEYPSTVEEQSVHLEIEYPDVQTSLSRWLPLVKWLLAIPHYILLFLLGVSACFIAFYAWFAILVTGRYPRSLFDFVVGVGRWGLRVGAYAFLLVTDRYPPFSMD